MKLKPKSDETQPPEGMTFDQWARAKYQEMATAINPCDTNGKLDPQRLNEVLTKFAQHFAWGITIQEVETNKLNRMTHDYDNWYKRRYNNALRVIREEDGGGGRAPGQTTIEARLAEIDGEDIAARQEVIRDQKSRVDLLKGFVKVLDKQASILQTLSSNMRSEMFFAAGVPINGNLTEGERNNKARAAIRRATKNQTDATDS